MTEINNIKDTKVLVGGRTVGTLIRCWYKCKMVQPNWKTGKQFKVQSVLKM